MNSNSQRLHLASLPAMPRNSSGRCACCGKMWRGRGKAGRRGEGRPNVQNRTPGCQVFREAIFDCSFGESPRQRGRKGRSAESCIFSGLRHAAHHRNVSTRPEIKCLSNDTPGESRATSGWWSLPAKVDRFTGQRQ